jgi:hypothetical protein
MGIYNDRDVETCPYTRDVIHYHLLNMLRIRLLANHLQYLLYNYSVWGPMSKLHQGKSSRGDSVLATAALQHANTRPHPFLPSIYGKASTERTMLLCGRNTYRAQKQQKNEMHLTLSFRNFGFRFVLTTYTVQSTTLLLVVLVCIGTSFD